MANTILKNDVERRSDHAQTEFSSTPSEKKDSSSSSDSKPSGNQYLLAKDEKIPSSASPKMGSALFEKDGILPEKLLALATEKLERSSEIKDEKLREKLIQEARQDLGTILKHEPNHIAALKTLALSLDLDPTWIQEDGSVNATKATLIKINLAGEGQRSLALVNEGISFPQAGRKISDEEVQFLRKNLLGGARNFFCSPATIKKKRSSNFSPKKVSTPLRSAKCCKALRSNWIRSIKK